MRRAQEPSMAALRTFGKPYVALVCSVIALTILARTFQTAQVTDSSTGYQPKVVVIQDKTADTEFHTVGSALPRMQRTRRGGRGPA